MQKLFLFLGSISFGVSPLHRCFFRRASVEHHKSIAVKAPEFAGSIENQLPA
jgi:hypothetical protein